MSLMVPTSSSTPTSTSSLSGPIALSWLELSRGALRHNVKHLSGPGRPPLMAVIKAQAYGHGAEQTAREVLHAGAQWLAVFSVDEALQLRAADIDAPILVLGPSLPMQLTAASQADLRLTVAGPEALQMILAAKPGPLKLHVKVETGTHRQGFMPSELPSLQALAAHPELQIEGVYSHFADIEDTTDHRYAQGQLSQFTEQLKNLDALVGRTALRHMACSAALLLFPETYFDLVRAGISLYGLWPSRETLLSAGAKSSEQTPTAALELRPVMAWKTRIAQVKEVPAGSSVAYGRTFQTTRPSRLAVLPVGYANGYPRALSNRAHVLVHGQIAGLAGRVMMNMVVVDVSDIPQARAGDEVILLGRQGERELRAEDLASWAGSINYEIVTRAEPHGLRLWVD